MGQVLPRPGQPHSCPPLGRPGLGSSRPSLSPRQAAPGVTLPLCVSRACPSIQPVAPSRRAGDTLSTVSVACWEAGRVCPPLVGSPARSTAAQTLLLPLGVTSLSVPWLPHRNLLFLLGETPSKPGLVRTPLSPKPWQSPRHCLADPRGSLSRQPGPRPAVAIHPWTPAAQVPQRSLSCVPCHHHKSLKCARSLGLFLLSPVPSFPRVHLVQTSACGAHLHLPDSISLA